MLDAPDEASNSLFLNIDSEPTSPTMIWDIPVTAGPEEKTASWRGSGTFDANEFVPKVFNLTVGTHTLIIRGREANTKLDRVAIEYFPASSPTPTPTPTPSLTLTPAPTPTPSPTPTPTQFPTATPTPLPTVTSTPTPKPTSTPTPTATSTPTPFPTSTPTPTPVPGDTTPPTAPANLTAQAVSSSQINLSWTASTDNVGVTGYNIYRNNAKVATIPASSTSYGEADLLPATTYSYYVKAFDGAGNVSPSSNTATATTHSPAISPGSIKGVVSSSLGGALGGVKVSVTVSGAKKTT
ncbi:MAG: fibronectin type III domain-containing protein, partial [Patescibacteria group bacterium]|nr:fibronectin type III domain-containing protein [Patescibacteria group bacterium]